MTSPAGTTLTLMERRIRRGAALTTVGLLLQLLAALHWTPATFILSAALGLPLVLIGACTFLGAVWRSLRDKGAV